MKVSAVAAYSVATASAQGRTIDGTFCLPPTTAGPPPGHWFCMQAAFDGQTVQGDCNQIVPLSSAPTACNSDLASEDPDGTVVNTGVLTLTPGTYWIRVVDNSSAHNFELRSCPGASSPCDPSSGGLEQRITGVPDTPGTVTVKVQLKHGWYRLFCDATSPVIHEPRGMYVDIEVGGVGQVG